MTILDKLKDLQDKYEQARTEIDKKFYEGLAELLIEKMKKKGDLED